MRFGILGPTEVRRGDGRAVPVGGPRLRALLALLLLDAGRVVTTERLIDGLYGTAPPAGAVNALQAQISRLRSLLSGSPSADGDPVVRHPAGYLLAVDPADVDAYRFERLAAEGRGALASGDPARAATTLRAALDLWRGPAFADVGDAPFAAAQAVRLDEMRLTAAEDHAEARLTLGGHRELVAELQDLVAAHPLRERLCGQFMRALYASGRQAQALAVYEELRRRLADELGADPSAELVGVHVAVLRADPSLDASPAPTRLGLPAQITALVGRTEELDRVGRLLAEARLVTLTGPGGTGKTRLAAEAAARQDGDVCFVELAPLGDGADLPQAVLGALGLRQSGSITAAPGRQAPDPSARLAAALAGRSLLLVLDNCEHVVDAAARLVALLLGSCPGLRVLTTGREALGITGERLCPVPPLALPPPGTSTSETLGYPALRLFAERAVAVRPDFLMEADEAEAALRICETLDGLPLAIELAAARLRSLTAAEVATRLGAVGEGTRRDRFELLSRGSRTAQPRHRTLRAVVQWSWDLLDGSEQVLARRLTVFAGGATLEAAERVCGLPDTDGVLASLVDKSLVEVVGGRYRMLETIRAFCAERLREADEEERLRRAHIAYFTELAETADPYLRRTEQLEWLRRLDQEHDNLHAALHRATEAEDLEDALRLLSALAGYWFLRGLRAEGAALGVTLLRKIGPEPPPGLDEEHALCALTAASSGIDAPEIGPSLERAIRFVDQAETSPRQPFVTVLRAVIVGPPPDWDTTDELQYRLERISPDPWMHALGQFSRGYLHVFRGRPADAERELTSVLGAFRSIGDRWGMVATLSGLADLATWRGDWARSAALTDEALDLAERLEATIDVAEMLCRRAEGRSRNGDEAGALADYERAAELALGAGAPEVVAAAHLGLGELARLRGDLTEASRRCEFALESCTTDAFAVEETRARVYVALGWISEAEGDADMALAWHRRALTVAHDIRNLPLMALVAEGLAGVTLLSGDAERAALLLGSGTALRGCDRAGHPDLVRVMTAARSMLGTAAYESARARGEEMARGGIRAIGASPHPVLTVMEEHLMTLGR
ncbi:BTAD domain-containing putative transcriptional regulator [Microtetraspora glauca]|uniref:BTAD domain-containing putative transcriptional regulator n=1 Tax=Microtetraspora glauca TaxID=1996 RepID=A0ABV3GCX4_MICGL